MPADRQGEGGPRQGPAGIGCGDVSEESKGGMKYLKWYVDTAAAWDRRLTRAQIGDLFVAVMYYVGTGEKVEFPNEIGVIFDEQCLRVDGARKGYANKCEAAAKNGAAGGLAKARNAAKARAEAPEATPPPKQAPKFIPPTKTEFRDIVKHLRDNGEIDADNCEADDFYEELCENDWTIGDRSIKSRRDVKSIVLYKFNATPYFGDRMVAWNCFRAIFAKTGLVGEFEEFEGCYDDKGEMWTIDGNVYVNPFKAVEAYLNRPPEDEEATPTPPKPP